MLENLEFQPINARHLTLESCEKWSYGLGIYRGQKVQVAQYRDKTGVLVAQKLRTRDKDFVILGNGKKMPLFGMHLWPSTGGKRVVITEGEIDAISLSQVQGHSWPVVSVPTGSKGAADCLKNHIEWLEQFEEVVLCFDMDEAGRLAVQECSEIGFTPGKLKVAELPLKDANECLKSDRVKELKDAIWNARAFRPDGIIDGADMTMDSLNKKGVIGYDTPYPGLNAMLHGIRKGELTLISAGTGLGKSTLARHVSHHFAKEHHLKIANVFLEEGFNKTAQGFIAIDNGVPLGRLREDPSILTPEQYEASLNSVIRGKMWFYDHFGSMESEQLLSKLTYCSVGLGVDFIVLDHISIVISGLESSSEGERKDIDKLMTQLRSLIERTGVGIIAIVHLKQPEGKAHEEGGQVSLNQLRGSGSLKHIPDSIFALERDQQGENSDITQLRVLKNREWGDTGLAGHCCYHKDTGLLLHIDEKLVPKEEGEGKFPPKDNY